MSMENVFRMRCSELIHIKTKFEQFKAELCPQSITQLPITFEDIRSASGLIDSDDEDIMNDSISLNHLADPNDLPISDFNLHDINAKMTQKIIEIPHQAMSLKCVAQLVDIQAGNQTTAILRKYNRYQYIAPQHDNTVGICDLKPFEDVLIVVRVYEPFLYQRGVANGRVPRLSQEFHVLGKQTLDELRDKIYCHCQYGPFLDISNDFEQISKVAATDIPLNPVTNQGGVFFITDTFYKDMKGEDYPTEILDWMTRQPEIGPSYTKTMQETKFEDLSIRLGFSQLYRHYANCEHVVVFSDIRLLATTDSLKSCDYPVLRCVSSSRNTICIVCGLAEAAFLIRKTTAHLQDPSYLCQSCLISYHYIDGEKNGQFEAFRVYGKRPLPNQ